MTDKDVRRKLNKMRELANELAVEAKARYGREGHLFYESEGHFCLMDGDSEGYAGERQEHVLLDADRLAKAAWVAELKTEGYPPEMDQVAMFKVDTLFGNRGIIDPGTRH